MHGLGASVKVKLPPAINTAAKEVPALRATGDKVVEAMNAASGVALILGGVAAVAFVIWLFARK